MIPKSPISIEPPPLDAGNSVPGPGGQDIKFRVRILFHFFHQLRAHRTTLQCERCTSRSKACTPTDTGACLECRTSKQGCSLTVHNALGEPIKKPMTPEEVHQYRLEQLQKEGKGKEPARSSSEEEKGEWLGFGIVDENSPSATLGPSLQELTLGASPTSQEASTSPGPSSMSPGLNSRAASEFVAPAPASPAFAAPANTVREPVASSSSALLDAPAPTTVASISRSLVESCPCLRTPTDLDILREWTVYQAQCGESMDGQLDSLKTEVVQLRAWKRIAEVWMIDVDRWMQVIGGKLENI
jgi:hypothetical protein